MSALHFRSSTCAGAALCGAIGSPTTSVVADVTCSQCLQPERLRAETARLRLRTARLQLFCVLNLRVQQLSRANIRKMQMQICRYREQTALNRSLFR